MVCFHVVGLCGSLWVSGHIWVSGYMTFIGSSMTFFDLEYLCSARDVCLCDRICLLLLCEDWDMFLFVCESRVAMCDLFVLGVWLRPCVDGSRYVLVCFYIVCDHFLTRDIIKF